MEVTLNNYSGEEFAIHDGRFGKFRADELVAGDYVVTDYGSSGPDSPPGIMALSRVESVSDGKLVLAGLMPIGVDSPNFKLHKQPGDHNDELGEGE